MLWSSATLVVCGAIAAMVIALLYGCAADPRGRDFKLMIRDCKDPSEFSFVEWIVDDHGFDLKAGGHTTSNDVI